MTAQTFDFTEEQPWESGVYLGQGNYRVEVEDLEEGESSGGHPQVIVTLRDLKGSGTIRDWVVLTQATKGKWLQIVDALGVDRPTNPKVPSKEWSQHVVKLGGKSCYVRVEAEEYGGQVRNKVQFYTAQELSPLGPEDHVSDVPADTSGMNGDPGGATGEGDADIPF